MSNYRLHVILPLLVIALILVMAPANASTVEYTDQASWLANTSSTTAIPFTGLAPASSSVTYNTSTGLVINGVQFLGYLTATSYQLAVLDTNYVSPYFNFGSPSVQSPTYDRAQGSNALPYIRVILPTGTTAFSTYLDTVSPNSLVYDVKLPDGSEYTVPTASRPTPTFVGVTSTSAISYVDFTVLGTTYNGGTYGLLQNFSIGTAGTAQPQVTPSDTPEAATLILIGLGLAFVRKFRRYGMHGGMSAA